MKWLEISVQCDGEAAEAVSELFNRFNKSQGETQAGAVIEVAGFDAIGRLIDPLVTVRTYLPQDETGRERRRRIEEGLWFLSRIHPIPEPLIRELAEEDWATAWQAHYKPMRVGRRWLIVPAWQADEVDVSGATTAHSADAAGRFAKGSPLPIILDPGMAFGTGMHPSTRLCLAALEDVVRPGQALLDVGCGSGILSIAAARLGAAPILATDTDPIAVAATVENCRLNGVEKLVEARPGSLPAPAQCPGGWPVIVVNILAEVIVDLLAAGLADLLAAEGRLVLSGIIDERADDVLAALAGQGLQVVQRQEEGEWVGLVAEAV